MLGILDLLFNAIIEHHNRVDKSLVGVEEVLLVAEEQDFVNRRVNNYMSLQSTFASSEMYGLPMHLQGGQQPTNHNLRPRIGWLDPEPISDWLVV